MKNFFFLLILPLIFSDVVAQVGVNSSGSSPQPSAGLDVDFNNKGMLIPRMTTAERDAVNLPSQALQIYNTTTQCFEFWENGHWQSMGCACIVPTGASATAFPSAMCAGGTLLLIGNAVGATTWSWTGPNGFSSSVQNPTITDISSAGSGVYSLIAGSPCGPATAVSTVSVIVYDLPTTADAGEDINPACEATSVTLAGNTPSVGTGNWSVISGTATVTSPGSPTSGITGLAIPGSATLRWTISDSHCPSSSDDVVITTCVFTCGGVFSDSRDSKTYNTALFGSKCWMKENLNYGSRVNGSVDQTNNSVAEKYCYNDADSDCDTYGGLYQWGETVQYLNGASNTSSWSPMPGGNVQGICPPGWHVPSDAEWCDMENTVEAGTDSGCSGSGFRGTNTGNKMKVTSGSVPAWDGTNTSGFSGLPGGYRGYTGGTFDDQGLDTDFWSTGEVNPTTVWARGLHSGLSGVGRLSYGTKTGGFSVRCVRD